MWGRLCDPKSCYKTGGGNEEIVLCLIQIRNSHLPKLGCGNGELHILKTCAFLEEVFLKLVAHVFEKDLLEVIKSAELISQPKIKTINILNQDKKYSSLVRLVEASAPDSCSGDQIFLRCDVYNHICSQKQAENSIPAAITSLGSSPCILVSIFDILWDKGEPAAFH